MIPSYLKPHQDGAYLAVKVQPRASENAIGEALGSELKIKVTAPPVDSAANEAVVRLLAKHLKCPRSAVRIVRGQTSRHKMLFIEGLDSETVLRNLDSNR